MVLAGVLAGSPAFAQDGQRRRGGSDRRGEQSSGGTNRDQSRRGERAVPRQNDGNRQEEIQRRNESQRQAEAQRQESQRQAQAERQESQRRFESQRQDSQRRAQAQRQYDAQRRYDDRRSDDRGFGGRAVPRPSYSNRGYGYGYGRAPRIIRPSIVTIVPYRPYVYRPSLSIGVFYGSGGAYPYGYTPRGYYDPIPGRFYGGLRITGAPREAQVFADGYYVGIVNDFDGVFQHLNLEAGPHHIEIEEPGFEPVAFDLIVQAGRTITFRAEMYPY